MATKVTIQNFETEILHVFGLLLDQDNCYVGIDTEFPRLYISTPREANDHIRYEHLLSNMNRSILFQVGLSVMDDQGNVIGIWEFYLYDKEWMEYLTDNCDVMFGRVPLNGIPHIIFGAAFRRILADTHGKVNWVTFHGLYDLAHLLVLVSSDRCLPELVSEFVNVVGMMFGQVYDIKDMVGKLVETYPSYGPIFGKVDHLGLEKLAAMVGVRRVGYAHQAGSDSLVTAHVFAKFVAIYQDLGGLKLGDVEGFLHGISSYQIICHKYDKLCAVEWQDFDLEVASEIISQFCEKFALFALS